MRKLINFIAALDYRRKVRAFNRKQNFRHFRKACRKARQLSKDNDGKRFRVFLFDEYRTLTRDDIQRMKNQGILSKHEETGILSKNCFYDTMTDTNTHPQFSNRKV